MAYKLREKYVVHIFYRVEYYTYEMHAAFCMNAHCYLTFKKESARCKISMYVDSHKVVPIPDFITLNHENVESIRNWSVV